MAPGQTPRFPPSCSPWSSPSGFTNSRSNLQSARSSKPAWSASLSLSQWWFTSVFVLPARVASSISNSDHVTARLHHTSRRALRKRSAPERAALVDRSHPHHSHSPRRPPFLEKVRAFRNPHRLPNPLLAQP